MGKNTDFTGIGIYGLQDAVEEILREYGDAVYQATEDGLDIAEKVLIKNLKAATPGKAPHKRNFAKGWKGTGKKYKGMRFVGNTTIVTNKAGEEIALANIFEYSTTRGEPFINKTYGNSIDEMAAAIVAKIKEV